DARIQVQGEAESLGSIPGEHARHQRLGAQGDAQRMDMRMRDGDGGGHVSSAPGRHFHTSRATSTMRSSLRHCSSSVRLLPWCVLEKPHWGERQRFSSETNFAASFILPIKNSLDSSCADFDVMMPSTTF